MKLFMTLSKKSIAVILAAFIIFIFLAGRVFSIRAEEKDGSTNALRVAYITGLGYKVDETPVNTKDIVIPDEFSQVYNKYNELQKKAGFDLSAYRGKPAQVCTYRIDEKIVVNLIISEGAVIGGDVSQTSVYGEMLPLTEKNDENRKTR